MNDCPRCSVFFHGLGVTAKKVTAKKVTKTRAKKRTTVVDDNSFRSEMVSLVEATRAEQKEKAGPTEKRRSRGSRTSRADTWLALAGDSVQGAAEAIGLSEHTRQWCGAWYQQAVHALEKAQAARHVEEPLRKAILFSGAAYGCAEFIWRAQEIKSGRSGRGFDTVIGRKTQELRTAAERRTKRIHRLVY